MSHKDSDQLSDAETAKRRDAIVRRMIATPPQPRPSKQSESKAKVRPRKAKDQ